MVDRRRGAPPPSPACSLSPCLAHVLSAVAGLGSRPLCSVLDEDHGRRLGRGTRCRVHRRRHARFQSEHRWAASCARWYTDMDLPNLRGRLPSRVQLAEKRWATRRCVSVSLLEVAVLAWFWEHAVREECRRAPNPDQAAVRVEVEVHQAALPDQATSVCLADAPTVLRRSLESM